MTSIDVTVWPTPIDPDEHAELFVDGPAALDWQTREDARTRAELETWPHFGAVRDLVAHLAPPREEPAVPVAGGTLRIEPSDLGPGPVLRYEPVDGGSSRLVLDAGGRAREGGEPLGLDYARPSPDGRHVVVGIGPKGAERSVLQVVDVQAGHVYPLRDPFAGRSAPAWLPDGSGFLYSAGVAADDENLQRCIKEYRLGDPGATVVDVDLRGRIWAQAQVSPRYAVVLGYEGNFHPRPWYVRAHDDPEGRWRPFLADAEDEIRGEFVGDEYVAVHLTRERLGRVVAIPLDAAEDPSSWREIVAESELALRGVRYLGGDLLLVSGMHDGVRSARLVRLDGTPVANIEPPEPGVTQFPVPEYATLAPSVPEDAEAPDEIVFAHSAFDRSTVRFAAGTSDGSVRAISEPAVAVDGITRRRVAVQADDGVELAVDLAYRGDADLDRPRPALIWAYGGFNSTGERGYDPLSVAFVLSGGIVVLPHLRGGGERGRPWWHAGRREHKQRTFDDLYAVAEHLLATGISDRIAVHGASNGGLLAAVAATQRPDLWAAVGSLVPVTDLRRIVRDPWGEFRCSPEYGDPRVDEEAAWLADYSPYHAVRSGTEYPPTIVVAGANDRRTFPWHARVFTAALQDAGATARLLAVPDDGHFAILDPGTQHWWLSFYLQHLGMTPAALEDVKVRRLVDRG